ncbi:reverse transcriptase [Senna tora]|uniref:Reverse transcriptase n=1 Tax=Senna tora TaxID=362788 RepID=A0A834WX00_9FABA|nr:reverse transcriptase [Senna tora]
MSIMTNSLNTLVQSRCRVVGDVVFQHVFKEGNRVADAMAAKAYNSPYMLVFLSTPPSEIVPLLDKDASGVGTLRSCVV